MVTISPITEHHMNSTFALRAANSEGHQLYRWQDRGLGEHLIQCHDEHLNQCHDEHLSQCHVMMLRVRMMDMAAAKEEERQEGRVTTNVFAYVMSCLVY